MANRKIKKLKVIFEPNTEVVDPIFEDVLITQLMVTISQIGLRTDHYRNNDAIIGKGKEHGSKKD